MAFRPNRTQINCPQCGAPAVAAVYNIVDAVEQPELKSALLAGELNLFQCPACRMVGTLQAPLIYHDSSKELLLAFIPMGMNLSALDEERFIAQATNAIINHTPNEQRKGYLLRPPTRAISMQGLAETILEADGVSREEIRKQTERVRLIGQLIDLVDKEEQLKAAVAEHRALIDKKLLMLIGASMEAASEMGDQQMVNRYTTLRQKLITLAELDPKEVPALGIEGAYEQILEMLRAAPPERLQGIVAANSPYLDYGFFLFLTKQMEVSTGEEQKALEALRTELVRLTEEMDAQAQQAMERATHQLREIMASSDIEAAVQSRLNELDEAFLVVLQANMEAAQQQNRTDILQHLAQIYQTTIMLLQEKLRPELRLINQMLQTQSAETRHQLMQEALRTYNPPGFLEVVQQLAEDAQAQGANPQVVAQLQQLEAEVAAAIQGQGAGSAGPKKSSLILTPEDEKRGPSGEAPKIILPGR